MQLFQHLCIQYGGLLKMWASTKQTNGTGAKARVQFWPGPSQLAAVPIKLSQLQFVLTRNWKREVGGGCALSSID